MSSTRNPGRVAGWLYLVMTLLGLFTLMYVPTKLIVPGNAAATASNILSSEMLYRFSIAVGLVSSVLFLFLARALYRLLNVVHEGYASLMVILVVISVAIGFAFSVLDLGALLVLRGGDYLTVFSQPQREALAMLFIRSSGQGTVVSEIFWGLWLFPFGALVFRSGFLPRILGVLLLINGAAYLVASLTGLLLPAYAGIVNQIAMIPETGEIWIMLWLLIKGARPQPLEAAKQAVAG